MSICLSVAKYNLRHNYLPQIAAAVGLLILTSVIFGITALDVMSIAYPLELGLPFLGVILLTPVYSPEHESGILDTVRARKTPHLLICGIRIIIAVIFVVVFILGFALMMFVSESAVSISHALASCANAVFLGGLGVFASAVGGHAVIGYMVPVLYFVLDLMGGVDLLTMFSMLRSGTTEGKWVLLIIGIGCIAASMWVWSIAAKQR